MRKKQKKSMKKTNKITTKQVGANNRTMTQIDQKRKTKIKRKYEKVLNLLKSKGFY